MNERMGQINDNDFYPASYTSIFKTTAAKINLNVFDFQQFVLTRNEQYWTLQNGTCRRLLFSNDVVPSTAGGLCI